MSVLSSWGFFVVLWAIPGACLVAWAVGVAVLAVLGARDERRAAEARRAAADAAEQELAADEARMWAEVAELECLYALPARAGRA
jgi:hypothetical protein